MKKKIIVSGGGTAGHVYPILEVVKLLKKRHPKFDFLYIGSRRSIEEKIVGNIIPYVSIPAGKLHRALTLKHFNQAYSAVKGLLQAKKIINDFKPDLVFVKGGFVSLPVLLAARAKKVPIVVHESDVVMGLSNKIGLRVAAKICVSYPKKYYKNIDKNKMIFTGLPIRQGFFKPVQNKDRQMFNLKKDLPVLLVTGGSQGSEALNNVLEPLIPYLAGRVQIIHLTGAKHEQRFIKIKRTLSREVAPHYHPFGFLEKGMEAAVNVSDLAVSRSGSTIAELAAAAVPMILIPLPWAAGDHQTKNAEIYAKEGAAITLKQNHLTPERLRDTIYAILDDKHRFSSMKAAGSRMTVKDSADRMVRVIEEELNK